MVVGVGNSGGDIAVELSRVAKQVNFGHVVQTYVHVYQVYLVTRRGTWVMNRIFDYGYPVDVVINNRITSALRAALPTRVVEL